MTIVAIASQRSRLPFLEKVVAALRPQVDTLRVYLNDFDERPDFLTAEEALLGKDAAGDLGDAGKFYWFDVETYTYYLTADDDLHYPPDYVATLVKEFEARKRQAIVGVHGFVFSLPIESYNNSRAERYKGTHVLDSPKSVHIMGTGTVILHPDTIKLGMQDFPHRNMADLNLAIAAQHQEVPMIIIPRAEGWIAEQVPGDAAGGTSIWQQVKARGGIEEATIARKSVKEWRLLPDPLT